jgi:signal transduction histidine kinase
MPRCEPTVSGLIGWHRRDEVALTRAHACPPTLRWGLDPVDLWLMALRAVALIGAVIWWDQCPLDPGAKRQLAWLLGTFAAYSAALYLVNALRPGRLVLIYRVAMVLDLAFVLALVRMTGGMASNFYLAFYLLIALHGYYFGLATGAGVAAAVALIYPFADVWPPPMPLSDFILRAGFFVLVGICSGALAERERRERRLVERLNWELESRQAHLQEVHQQLIHSDRLATVGELAAGLAHDLRNPLAGVSAALYVLSAQFPDDDSRKALLSDIQSQIARMNRTLTDLLLHARPPRPQYLALNVNDILQQSLWFLPAPSGTGIDIVKRLAPDLPTLLADPSLLHQAFLNILVNARQAMPDGGRLTVTTALRGAGAGEAVEVAIADSGLGISPEHLARVFQPFFTTKTSGTGLGLAIAARIIDQHGGRITVQSEPGTGATFHVILPVAVGDAAGSQGHAIEAAGG